MNEDAAPDLTTPAPKIPITYEAWIQSALEQGIHPRLIRLAMAAEGVQFRYEFSSHEKFSRNGHPLGRRISHQGNGERQRRIKQLRLCANGCGARRPGKQKSAVWVCNDCLMEKWK